MKHARGPVAFFFLGLGTAFLIGGIYMIRKAERLEKAAAAAQAQTAAPVPAAPAPEPAAAAPVKAVEAAEKRASRGSAGSIPSHPGSTGLMDAPAQSVVIQPAVTMPALRTDIARPARSASPEPAR